VPSNKGQEDVHTALFKRKTVASLGAGHGPSGAIAHTLDIAGASACKKREVRPKPPR